MGFSHSVLVISDNSVSECIELLQIGFAWILIKKNMSSDITQGSISISITLDIGRWVIRCCHYCPLSLLGETQLSRVEHTAIVSTICYEKCDTQTANRPPVYFNRPVYLKHIAS